MKTIEEDVTGDETAEQPHIVVVQNWFEELKQRVPIP